MASVPVHIEDANPPIEKLTVKIDPENTAEDLEGQFLKEWGFSLRDTYKLTLRFYKGKNWFLLLNPFFGLQTALNMLREPIQVVHRLPRSKVRIQIAAVM